MRTYREEDITVVHEDHDEAPDTSKVVKVREDQEYDGDDMMRHHLVVVLATRFGVQDHDLVYV